MNELTFIPSKNLTVGVELEIQLLDPETYNLTPKASQLLTQIQSMKHPGEIKPELTEGMIEISTSIHQQVSALHQELYEINHFLGQEATKINALLSGGGTHAFQDWKHRQIHPNYQPIYEKYDFLAKKFTVFGQHIHIGCADPDKLIYLIHAFARYIPHFITLSASSPFYEGEETQFHSTRLHLVDAFPLSGPFPFVENWQAFKRYFSTASEFNVAKELRNFYWDIRLRPEFGTLELRICDTPLTLMRAAALTAYAQTLACYFLEETPIKPKQEIYLPYMFNRFQACRHGPDGVITPEISQPQTSIKEDILKTFDQLMPYAKHLKNEGYLYFLQDSMAKECRNDSEELKMHCARHGNIKATTQYQSHLWMNENINNPLKATPTQECHSTNE